MSGDRADTRTDPSAMRWRRSAQAAGEGNGSSRHPRRPDLGKGEPQECRPDQQGRRGFCGGRVWVFVGEDHLPCRAGPLSGPNGGNAVVDGDQQGDASSASVRPWRHLRP